MIVGPTFFSSPSSPTGNVVLLQHYDGDFLDYSSFHRTITTNGVPARSTSNQKFGSECYEGSSTGWLSAVDDGSFDFEDKVFSVDFWLYVSSSASLATDNVVCGKWGVSDGSWFINLFGPTEYLNLGRKTGGTFIFDTITTAPIPRDTLIHVAVWRPAVGVGVLTALNGVIDTTIGGATDFDSTAENLGIGSVMGGGAALPAGVKVDELRICVDIIDYGFANFTPPTAPYPNP